MGGKPRTRLTLGWKEWVSLPEFADVPIRAKLDTGAKSSSLHAENIRRVRRSEGSFVYFTIFPEDGRPSQGCDVVAPFVSFRNVRSSNGMVGRRIVVTTTLEVAGRSKRIELTLADRSVMGFQLLIGRDSMRALRASVNPIVAYAAAKLEP